MPQYLNELIFIMFLVSQFNFSVSICFWFLPWVISFFGDLLESFFKRKIGVKDSGKLIPGHGGLMDRFDGYFLVIPFLYISINWKLW